MGFNVQFWDEAAEQILLGGAVYFVSNFAGNVKGVVVEHQSAAQTLLDTGVFKNCKQANDRCYILEKHDHVSARTYAK